jgi:nitrate reductase NapE component
VTLRTEFAEIFLSPALRERIDDSRINLAIVSALWPVHLAVGVGGSYG